MGEHLHIKAGICLHHGKTKIWNSQGVKPKHIDALEKEARRVQPEAVVWRGDPELLESKQGLTVLGVPVDHPSYILSQLEQKADEHEELLRRIPAIQDVQAAWLLLQYCAVPRANHWLRTVQPELTASFAERHDKDVWTRLCEILQINGVGSKVVSSASLPLTLGGVGLGSALRIREAANWASWADCLEMVRERHPSIATAMIEGITLKSQGCTGSVARTAEALQKVGMEMPSWMELSERARPGGQGPRERDSTEPQHGW